MARHTKGFRMGSTPSNTFVSSSSRWRAQDFYQEKVRTLKHIVNSSEARLETIQKENQSRLEIIQRGSYEVMLDCVACC